MLKKPFLTLLVAGAAILCAFLLPQSSKNPGTGSEGTLSIHIIDVGNADSIYIALPNQKNMLIDGGDVDSFDTISDYLNQQGVTAIDYCVATHPHSDHIGSLDDIINAYPIKNIYMTAASNNTKTFEQFLTAVKNSGAPVHKAAAGQTIFEEEGLRADILSPLPNNDLTDMNNASIVIRLKYGNTSCLLMGDAEKEVEQALLDSGQALKADILKVGHHGSHTSSSPTFIAAVSPGYAAITCGADNPYGHPAQPTLQTFAQKGIQTFRSDQDGTVVFYSDGEHISVTTGK